MPVRRLSTNILAPFALLLRGGSRNFLKGGLYTIVVTFNANGVEGELRPRPLTRALKSSGAMPLPPL